MPYITKELFVADDTPERVMQTKWWIKNACGYIVYVHKRERKDAQSVVDEYYGKGRYTINCR